MNIILSTVYGASAFFEGILHSPVLLGQAMHFVILAQASTVADLKLKLKEVLTILMLFGFLYGTIRIIGGASQMRRGEYEEGKASIVSGALIAAAPLIMRILFEIFFNGEGTLFVK